MITLQGHNYPAGGGKWETSELVNTLKVKFKCLKYLCLCLNVSNTYQMLKLFKKACHF